MKRYNPMLYNLEEAGNTIAYIDESRDMSDEDIDTAWHCLEPCSDMQITVITIGAKKLETYRRNIK